MPEFERFDSSTVHELREELQQVLDDFGASYGLVVRLGNAKYSPGEVRFINMTATLPNVKADEDDGRLDMYMRMHGIKSKTSADGSMTLIKYDSKKHAYPWIYTQDGKNYKCDVRRARLYFGVSI